MNPLERRYRRLLGYYPRGHRERYAEEMLGVLLDSAAPGRTRPTLGEATNLLAGAVRYRLGGVRDEFAGASWRAATAVLAVLAPGTMLVASLYRLAGRAALGPSFYGDRPPIGPSVWAPPVIWAVATLAVVAGPRLAAVATGWFGFAAEAAVQVVAYHRLGIFARPALWSLAVALLAATAVSARVAPRDGLRLLGPWRFAALAAIGAFIATGQLLYRADGGWPPQVAGLLIWGPGPRALTALAAVVAAARLPRPVRSRLLAAVSGLALLALAEAASEFAFFGDGGSAYLMPLQAAGAIPFALVGFAVLAWVVRHREAARV